VVSAINSGVRGTIMTTGDQLRITIITVEITVEATTEVVTGVTEEAAGRITENAIITSHVEVKEEMLVEEVQAPLKNE